MHGYSVSVCNLSHIIIKNYVQIKKKIIIIDDTLALSQRSTIYSMMNKDKESLAGLDNH